MEVKTRSDRYGDGIFEKYGKNRVVCKKDPQSVENSDREPSPHP